MSKSNTECPVQDSDKSDAGGCPVKDHGGASSSKCEVKGTNTSTSIFSSAYAMMFGAPNVGGRECGECEDDKGYNPLTNDLRFRNEPHPDQRIPLSKKRTISTIPKVSRSV